jgi:hypothetical protein
MLVWRSSSAPNAGQRGRQSDLRGTPVLDEIFDKHGQKPVYGPNDPIILRSRKDGLLPSKRIGTVV